MVDVIMTTFRLLLEEKAAPVRVPLHTMWEEFHLFLM